MERVIPLLEILHNENDYTLHQNCKMKLDEVRSCVECTSAHYFDGNEIDYSCRQKRRIYTLRYLPSHAVQNASALNDIVSLGLIGELDKRRLNVLSIGGGPGSDFLGFSIFFDRNKGLLKSVKKVNWTRIDEVRDWNDIANEVGEIFEIDGARMYDWAVNAVAMRLKDTLEYSLVLMSYFISELNEDEIKGLCHNIKRLMSKRAVIVLVDRNQDEVRGKAEAVIANLRVENYHSRVIRPHIGFSYPDAIKDVVKPKLTSECVYYIFSAERD